MQDHPNEPLTHNDSNDIPVSKMESDDESSPAVEKENSSQIEINQDHSTIENEEIQKEESHSRIVFRKFIRWTFGVLIIFGLGYLTAIFTIYTPKVDELDQSGKNLDNAQSTITALESEIIAQQNEIDRLGAQINDLETDISDLQTENQALVEKQSGFQLQITLLKTRSDVISAQVELYQENPAQTRLLLDSASQNLTTVESLLPENLKDVVSPLQNRLELAVGEIENDPETAISDLAILAGDLLEIENALFNE